MRLPPLFFTLLGRVNESFLSFKLQLYAGYLFLLGNYVADDLVEQDVLL